MSLVRARERLFRQSRAASGNTVKELGFYTTNLVWITLGITLFGLLIGYSASSTRLISEGLSPVREITGQIWFTIVGLVVMFLVSRFRFSPDAKGAGLYLLVKSSYWLSVVLLALVLLEAQVTKGATRTLDFGFIHFQPTELAKFGLVYYILYLLLVEPTLAIPSRLRYGALTVHLKLVDISKPAVRVSLALFASAVVLILTVCQPSVGNTIFIGILALAALSLGGVRKRWLTLIAIVVLIIGALYVYGDNDKYKHVGTRYKAWMNPLGTYETEGSETGGGLADRESYQILQSLGAIANGGLEGQGLFKGVQKINRLPEATNDFIFAVICEELGFLGAFGVAAAFFAMLYMICGIAMRIRNPFYSSVVFMIGLSIFIQAGINMGAAVSLFPTTGINLPLISFGGTSKLVTLSQIGLVLAIAYAFIRFERTRV